MQFLGEIVDNINIKKGDGLGSEVLFSLPEQPGELVECIGYFLLVVLVIIVVQYGWSKYAKHTCTLARRILFWELGTVVGILVARVLDKNCVILPLMFLLTFLVMWYLTRKLGGRKPMTGLFKKRD